MHSREILDELTALSGRLSLLRSRVTDDPANPSLLAESARDLFRPKMPHDGAVDIAEGVPGAFPGARFEFEGESGFCGRVMQPLKADPGIAPPEFQRGFRIHVDRIGTSRWLTLRLRASAAELRRAGHLWWELAGTARYAFDLRVRLRVFDAEHGFLDHDCGGGRLGPDRAVLAGTLDLSALDIPADARDPALYLFLDPVEGLDIGLDYLIAQSG